MPRAGPHSRYHTQNRTCCVFVHPRLDVPARKRNPPDGMFVVAPSTNPRCIRYPIVTALQPARSTAPATAFPLGGKELDGQVAHLEAALAQGLVLYDTATGQVRRPDDDLPAFDLDSRASLCDHVAQSGEVEVIEDFSPLLAVAIPLLEAQYTSQVVAVGVFVTQPVEGESCVAPAAEALGMDAGDALRWAQRQLVWNPHSVVTLARALTDGAGQAARLAMQEQRLSDVSGSLLSTLDELRLLHRLIEKLSLSPNSTDLNRSAIEWLVGASRAESIAVIHYGEPDADHAPQVHQHGQGPLSATELISLADHLGQAATPGWVAMDQAECRATAWGGRGVRQVLGVPIQSRDRLQGWLVALNHRDQHGFTNVEASLLTSVASILGVHAGNRKLFAQQQHFFAAVVRAFSSAIDAKDPYTCGHSDRVARLSVCLAREVGCGPADLNTIYLAGLLHDIGKIGIEDRVLRKPGGLTDQEYDHIKTHPELGRRILSGVKELESVLPIVLYHHEAWDGSGYPEGLKGEECPPLARIVAVADSIDAMTSDRPYRAGMGDEQLDQILRSGAGKQWDAEVIDAVFRAREQVREISRSGREPLSLDVSQWCD